MSAIETLLANLIDYAGLYPPAGLDMRAAVRNYREYRSGKYAFALGRFIVDVARLDEMLEAAGESFSEIRVSAIVPASVSPEEIEGILSTPLEIESVEIKCSEPLSICRISEVLPRHLEPYFEIPIRSGYSGAVDALATTGARAKLRMGGLVSESFPPADHVVEWLRLVADRRVPFKATAGLHHPIRSRHRLTFAPDSPIGTMHGFINFFCAAAFIHSGDAQCGKAVLEEEDPNAFRITSDAIAWRSHQWTTEQVRTIRQKFFTSYGSCSFTEPMQDLEALGWL
jgi:hypothetical protein